MSERTGGVSEQMGGVSERVSGVSERVSERASGAIEQLRGAIERVSGTSERVSGASERVNGASERVNCASERIKLKIVIGHLHTCFTKFLIVRTQPMIIGKDENDRLLKNDRALENAPITSIHLISNFHVK